MKVIFILIISGVLAGCSSTSKYQKIIEKEQESIRVAVYATHDSIMLGRFDLADKFSEESIKLVPPPEKRIEINPIIVEK